MKKTLLLLASAALLLVGCAKEQLSNGVDGEMTKVTFTANLQSGAATKAVADNDGNGAKVNRCIMEIYFDNQFYKRMVVGTSDTSPHTATFANVPVVAGKQYQVLFWADHVDNPADSTGLATDKYYNTTDGLKAVTVIKGSFIDALEDKCNDYLDAFFFADNYTVPQAGGNYTDIKLNRPFAQLNVITTDVGTDKTVTSETLLPKKVSVSYEAANKINVATGEIFKEGEVADYTYSYEADVYGAWSTVTTDHKELTLSMDYILAPKTEQGAIDVTFVTKNGGQPVMTHALANLPYKRNYRTNVKGDLLTVGGSWTATIDAEWDSGSQGENDFNIYYTTVSNASDVKGAIKSKTGDPQKNGQVLSVTINNEVGSGGASDDIIIPDNTTKATTPGIILDFKQLSADAQIVIRDEKHPVDQAVEDGAGEYAGELVVIVPEGITADQVKILTNKSTVTVRGEYGTVIASCAPQTIVIEKETVVGTLEVMKGNVEVYGKVGSIVNKTKEIEDDKEIVKVYLFQGSTWTNIESDKNDKLIPLYPVAKIAEKYYFSVEDAVTSVKDGDVLTLVSDVTLADKLLINGGKNFTFDLGGKTLTGRVNVDGANLVVKNGKIDAGTFNQALNVYGSKDPQYKDGIYTYVKVESDVILDGSNGSLCVMSINGNNYYPLSYGVKVDFYGKAYNVPAQVIGNLGFDNYKANIGNVDISDNLPAGITAPSKAMSLYGPIVNIYGEMKSTSTEEECQAFILSGMARVNVYEGAYLEGSEGFAMKSGNLHVYGGTIKSNGEKKDPVQAVNSGSEASGAAISITSYYTHDLFEDRAKIQVAIEGGDIQAINNAALLVTHSYEDSKPVALKQGVDLAITGGKFTSGSDVPVIFIDNAAEGDQFPMPSKFISGGLFNKAPEAGYIADGKKTEQNSQGYWEIAIDELATVNGVKYATVGEAVEAARTGDVINVYGTTNFTKADDGYCYTDAANKAGRLVLVELVNAGSPTTTATLKVNTAPSVQSMSFQTLWLGSESRLDAPGSYLKSGDVLVLPAKTFYIEDQSTIYDVYGDITFLGKKGKTIMKPWQTSADAYRFFRLYNRYKKNITDKVIYHYNFKDVTFDGSLEKHSGANLFVVTCYNIQINMDGCSVVNFPGSVFSIWANDTLSDGSYPTKEDNVGVEVNITNSTLTGNGRLVHYDCSPYQSRDIDASLDRYAFIHVNYDNNCTVNNTEEYSFNTNTARGQGNCLLNGVDVWPAEN